VILKRTSEEIAEVLEVVWTLEEQASATLDQVIASANANVSEGFIRQQVSGGAMRMRPSRLLSSRRIAGRSFGGIAWQNG
jgi:hypothetical protein